MNNTTYTPDTLAQEGFELIDKLSHMDMLPFIQTYMRQPTWYARSFTALNIGAIALWGVAIGWSAVSLHWSIILLHIGYGIGLCFIPIIPIHEYIHALAYKSQGARHTSFDVDWKNFIFMALADKFVINGRAFRVVALAPFVCISIALLLLLPWVSGPWVLTLITILAAHTSCCAGDFGLLSYFEYQQKQGYEIVTYDDKILKESYFLGRKQG
ncbi:DUF3267 domain-containing protein [Eisenibacter elegans]|uniref:DUF3267 domain-containing protein n=1 Tax=Eisenibacter elegans TaxID=997 RepID=UPI000402C5AF|nr:DUF3267 domain-containing protein [Eisenibacter elegans]